MKYRITFTDRCKQRYGRTKLDCINIAHDVLNTFCSVSQQGVADLLQSGRQDRMCKICSCFFYSIDAIKIGQRTIAKLMLNSLYGKFATQLKVRSRKPILEDDVLRYVDIPEYERDGVYLPVGCFITAWARFKTITTAQSCGDRFIYSDTDSVKVVGTDPIDGMWVDPVELGAWKDEGHFQRFKALRAKTYIAEYPDDDGSHIEVHVAGLPAKCHSQVTFENFRLGAEYGGKLYQKRVRGGIVLIEDGFKIKE